MSKWKVAVGPGKSKRNESGEKEITERRKTE
jgi:hypothetical protein